MNVDTTLDRGSPRLSCDLASPYRWEMFKHTPHAEGWVVLGWESYPDTDDHTCIESHEFGEDLSSALKLFAEVINRNPGTNPNGLASPDVESLHESEKCGSEHRY